MVYYSILCMHCALFTFASFIWLIFNSYSFFLPTSTSTFICTDLCNSNTCIQRQLLLHLLIFNQCSTNIPKIEEQHPLTETNSYHHPHSKIMDRPYTQPMLLLAEPRSFHNSNHGDTALTHHYHPFNNIYMCILITSMSMYIK